MNIRFSDVSVRFGERVALHPFSLTLEERRIGIIGLNGSGKTTFAKLINGLVKPTNGNVTVNGLDTKDDAKAVLALAGFIFQNPQHQLIMPVVREDLAFGLKQRGIKGDDLDMRIKTILERFGIENLANRRVHELSGGELQLAAIASVAVTGPEILIFDEPVNQLDIRNRKRVVEAILGLEESAVVISHDLGLLANFDRVLVFDQGRIVFDGAPASAIAHYEAVATC
ncbi:energy-coupling factor ABC transporter ATP-binding protein [Rhizobium sp. L1K21]|uniref:energy-coupling factor ABC transporter ATP-binding protein n=1 Tax=Rhizobium sp. L1K21 TaxID=2954933 RepID=UPI00209372E0|nr:ABC transporter ATP-binding protein [Rhizobium sp. L1K21]MCO6186868.1 energy-coupling factor ABC transporter ATP-binding protein [Rhizobium sp. L1K21]